MATIDEKMFNDLNSGNEKEKIEDILDYDEKILWQGKPSKISYVLSSVTKMLPIALIWILFDGAFIFLMCSDATSIPPQIIPFLVVFFLLHLMPVWIWINGIIKASLSVKNIRYAFTNKKIIIQSGIIGIDFKILNYAELTGINVKVGLIDKIFKVGDVYVNASSQSAVIFDIKEPYKIYNALQKISNDIKADILYPNAFRPSENPGYHTDYTDLKK